MASKASVRLIIYIHNGFGFVGLENMNDGIYRFIVHVVISRPNFLMPLRLLGVL